MNFAKEQRPGVGSEGNGKMHRTSPIEWTRRLRQSIDVLLVRADWLTSTLAAIRRRPHLDLTFALPGSRFWLLLGSALFDAAWLAVWSVVAIRYQSRLALFPASFPVLKWLLLLVARQPAESGPLEQPDAQSMPEPSGVFRQPTPATDQPDFDIDDPRQHWMGDREIVSHQISGAVQE
jgi:hypothetical protein